MSNAASVSARRSFLAEFLRTAALTVLPVLLFAAAVFVEHGFQRRAAVFDGLQRRAEAAASALDHLFRNQVVIMRTLSGSRTLDDGDLEAFYLEAQRALETQPDWLTIILSDTKGQQIANLLRPLGTPLPSVPDKESHDRVIRTQQPVIVGQPNKLGPVTQQPVFGIRVPVIRDGQVRYVLSAGFKLQAMQAVLNDLQLPPGWVGAIFDRDGAVMVCVRCPEDAVGRLASAPVLQHLRQGDSFASETTTHAGVESYFAASRAPLTGWAAGVRVPTKDVQALWSEGLWLLGLGGAISFAAALASMAWITHRRRTTERVLEDRVRDRTADLERALSERTLLMREIHHRVYNNLQIVDSLIRFTSRLDQAELGAGLTELSQRVRTLALVHRRLMETSDLVGFDIAPFLKELCADLEASLGADRQGAQISARIEPIRASLDFALPIGLFITEVVTLILKQAYDFQKFGLIDIRVSQSAGDSVVLTIADHGKGEVLRTVSSSDTLGARIVQSLTRQLNGKLEFEDTPVPLIIMTLPAPQGALDLTSALSMHKN